MEKVPVYLILEKGTFRSNTDKDEIMGTPLVMCLVENNFSGTSCIRFCWFLVYVAIYISAENSRGKNRKIIFIL